MWRSLSHAFLSLLGFDAHSPSTVVPEIETREGRTTFQLEPIGAVTIAEIGQPGQLIYTTGDFGLERTRLFGEEGCIPFNVCFDASNSLSFDALTAMEADGHSYAASDRITLNSFTYTDPGLAYIVKPDSEDFVVKGTGGRLALSPSSWIARNYRLELSYLNVLAEGFPAFTSGVEMVLHRRTGSLPVASRVFDLTIPLSQQLPSQWLVQAGGIRLNEFDFVGKQVSVLIDPGRPSIGIPPDFIIELEDLLALQTGRVVHSQNGFLMIPCDPLGSFLRHMTFEIQVHEGTWLPIHLDTGSPGGQVWDADSRLFFCETPFEPINDDHFIIGSYALMGRHSLILDSSSSTVVFRDFYRITPPAAPIVSGWDRPALPEFTGDFIFRAASGIEFSVAIPSSKRRFYIRSLFPQREGTGGSLVYSLLAASTRNHFAPYRTYELPHTYHMGPDGGRMQVLPQQRGRLMVPLVRTEDFERPSFKVSISLNNWFIHIKFKPQKVSEPYDDLEIGHGFVVADLSEDEECMICREEMLKEQSIDTVERCRHSFHSECLKEWVRRKPECARCIRPIPVRQGIYI